MLWIFLRLILFVYYSTLSQVSGFSAVFGMWPIFKLHRGMWPGSRFFNFMDDLKNIFQVNFRDVVQIK